MVISEKDDVIILSAAWAAVMIYWKLSMKYVVARRCSDLLRTPAFNRLVIHPSRKVTVAVTACWRRLIRWEQSGLSLGSYAYPRMPPNCANPSRDSATSSGGKRGEVTGTRSLSHGPGYQRQPCPRATLTLPSEPVPLLKTEWQTLTVLRAVVTSRNHFQQISCHQRHLPRDFPGPRKRNPTQPLWKLVFPQPSQLFNGGRHVLRL